MIGENSHTAAVEGCLVGMAIGDSIGLPYERLSARRIEKLCSNGLRQRFVLGWGMVSDDTEHMYLTGLAVVVAKNDPARFAAKLTTNLRWWIMTCPPGLGSATLRSCLKLCLGFKAENSGVHSAGNGPAMRSPILGVLYSLSPALLNEFVQISTVITHNDPKAQQGALLVAIAAGLSAEKNGKVQPSDYSNEVEKYASLGFLDIESVQLVKQIILDLSLNKTPAEFGKQFGIRNGVSGYIWQTVPMVLYVWLRYPGDYRQAITTIIKCGGDTDTTAGVLGAIIGAGVYKDGIPNEWISKLIVFPLKADWAKTLAQRLCEQTKTPGLYPKFLLLLLRNFAFLLVILVHVVRRLFPPY